MRKLQLILALAFIGLSLQAQEKAIGIRFSGGNSNGAEITYQMPIGGETNRLQLDLGANFDGDDNVSYLATTITGTYQWMWDLADVDGLAWYAGPGASVGLWMLNFDQAFNDLGVEDDSGLNLGIGGIVGIEYTIPSAPFQISLDSRPIWNISGADDYGSNIGVSLAARYLF